MSNLPGVRAVKRKWAEVSDRLLFVPAAFVVLAVVLSQLTLVVDRHLGEDSLPAFLETTVSSADSILSTIAGGLISATTLLLSLVLVSVQLASSQFSPRTLRDWIGDDVQRRTIGVVLGTTVYCLMILRETRTVSENVELAPHLSVLIAVPLAVLSLVAVVRSVDHLSNSMRIGSVARNLAAETVAAVERGDELARLGRSAPPHEAADAATTEAATCLLIAPRSGWIQNIDIDRVLEVLPDGATARLQAKTGTFVLPGQPVGSLSTEPDDEVSAGVAEAFTIGEVRNLDNDVGFGLLQMSDIAMRALSPGVNDPNTAADVALHMGVAMLALWERPVAPTQFESEGRRVIVDSTTHADYLDAGYAQIIRYAENEHDVLHAVVEALRSLRLEVVRRDLPGPVEPIDDMLQRVADVAGESDLSQADRRSIREAVAEAVAEGEAHRSDSAPDAASEPAPSESQTTDVEPADV